MTFDFIIAVTTVLGVKKSAGDGLAALLRRQGIGYFGLILIVHTITVVGTDLFRCINHCLTAS